MDAKQNIKYRIKNLFTNGKRIYHKTPVCFRWIFLPAKLISNFMYFLIDILKLDIWIISGEEISSKQELTINYAGREKNKNYLVHLAFGDFCKENYIGKKWLWYFLNMCKENNNGSSLMVAEIPRFLHLLFERKSSFLIPSWIGGEIDIPFDFSILAKSRSRQSDLSRIKKNKLDFEVTRSLDKFDNFYHNMYLPNIIRAHGERAIIMEYDFMKKKFKNCDLLLINKGTEYIAGTLIAYAKNKVRLWSAGIKDGNKDYMQDGAIGATHFFAIKYLKEKGFKKIGFGETRAFLKDGVLKHKKTWNRKVNSSSGPNILVKPLSKTPGVMGFFLNNPFIYMNNGRFNGAVFMSADQSFSKDDWQKLSEDYLLPGMSRLIIYRFGENVIRKQENIPLEFKNRVAVRSAESLFGRVNG